MTYEEQLARVRQVANDATEIMPKHGPIKWILSSDDLAALKAVLARLDDAERYAGHLATVLEASHDMFNRLPVNDQALCAERCRAFKGPCFCGCHTGSTAMSLKNGMG